MHRRTQDFAVEYRFTWWWVGQRAWGTEVPQWGPGQRPVVSLGVVQKLKQNVQLVYNF